MRLASVAPSTSLVWCGHRPVQKDRPTAKRAAISAARLGPDSAILKQLDLSVDDLFLVLGVLHRLPVQVQVFGIYRLLVKELVELCAKVLKPVVPLGASAVVPQRFNVDHARHVSGTRAVLLPAHDPALVIDHERAAATSVDGCRLVREEVIGRHVGGDEVRVVVDWPRPTLDLYHLLDRGRVEWRSG